MIPKYLAHVLRLKITLMDFAFKEIFACHLLFGFAWHKSPFTQVFKSNAKTPSRDLYRQMFGSQC